MHLKQAEISILRNRRINFIIIIINNIMLGWLVFMAERNAICCSYWVLHLPHVQLTEEWISKRPFKSSTCTWDFDFFFLLFMFLFLFVVAQKSLYLTFWDLLVCLKAIKKTVDCCAHKTPLALNENRDWYTVPSQWSCKIYYFSNRLI